MKANNNSYRKVCNENRASTESPTCTCWKSRSPPDSGSEFRQASCEYDGNFPFLTSFGHVRKDVRLDLQPENKLVELVVETHHG
jgi:hypothetical protein